ncbi:MAG: RHS repeat-associated core domain-containing protein [Caldilineales bacterium]
MAFAYGPDDERISKSAGSPGDTYDTVTVYPFYQIESGCLRADVDCDGDVDVMDIQKVASKFNTNYTPYEQNGVNPITTVDVMLVAEKWLWEGAGGGQQIVKTYSLGGRTVAIRRGGELTYLFQDHLGSPALETDDAGVPGSRWTYEPYGTMRGTEWTLPIDRGFTGQVIEQGLGLHDYGARHYAQSLGRWIAPDTIVPSPSNPQSLNRYSYTLGNPLKYKDPDGHIIETIWDVANVVWDIYEITENPKSLLNWGALAIDVVAVAIPFVPGGVGAVVYGGKAAKVGMEVVTHGDEVVDAARAAGHLGETAQTVLRFTQVTSDVLPDITRRFGGDLVQAGREILPETLSGRRITAIGGKVTPEQLRALAEPGARVLDMPQGWTLERNAEWIAEAIDGGDIIQLVTEISETTLSHPRFGISVFGRELDALLQAGYQRVGNYLIPPH